MIYDVTMFPASVQGTFKLYLNGSEITNICPRFDPESGWADIFIFDQDFNHIPDARDATEVMPMFARMFGEITVVGIKNVALLNAKEIGPNGETEKSTEFVRVKEFGFDE